MSACSSDDRELLNQFIATGSREAFAILFQRHVDWVYGIALRRVRDHALAQDIAQNVFVILAQRASSIRSSSALTAWLFATALFTAKAALREKQRRLSRERSAALMARTVDAT